MLQKALFKKQRLFYFSKKTNRHGLLKNFFQEVKIADPSKVCVFFMKLLTKELERKLPPLYATEKQEDPVVVVKFFTPWSFWSWYILEYDPKNRLFFGYVIGFDKELGYFSLDELGAIRGPYGLKIERDIHWKPMPLSRVKKGEVA